MANQKVPQLPILSTVTGVDLFYVVDVSDTTDDPTGSSKQITRDEILTEVNQIDFNLTAVTTHQEGRIAWNDDIKSLEIDTDNPNVQVQVGHEMVIRVNNQTGSILTKGTVVYINGAQGQRPTVTKADYSADTSSASVIGLVAADINNGANGYVITSGILEGVNTIDYTAGTSLYLFTGGTYSSNKPQAPDHDVRIGKVVVSNATTGSIYVNVQNGYELDELHDVRITSVSENDVLVRSIYNGSPVWVNTKTMSGLTYVGVTTISATTISGTTFYGNGTNLTGVVKGSGTANYLPRWTGTTGLGDSIIRDDGTNIGIGSAPSANYKAFIFTTTNYYGLYVRNAFATTGSRGIYGASDSGVGDQIGVVGVGQGHPTSGTSIGVYGSGTDGSVAIGVKGEVGPSEFGSITTGLGGYFDGRGTGEYGYPAISYGIQVIDGTEGVNKILQSQTSDGKTNWVDPLTVQTAFNYGLANAIMTGTFLT